MMPEQGPHTIEKQAQSSRSEVVARIQWLTTRAVAGSLALAATTGLALAKAPPTLLPANTPPLPECALNYLSGPNAACDNTAVPETCLPGDSINQLSHYDFMPSIQRRGSLIADDNLAMQPTEAGLTPHLTLGTEDDGAIINADQNRPNAVLALGKAMHATQQRMIIYSYLWPYKHRQENLDRAVDASNACGFNVQLTLACDRTTWTPERFYRYVHEVAEHFKGRVYSYSICNEPNYGDWLRPMPGTNTAGTYCSLYRQGYKAVNDVNVQNQVVFGDLSSLRYPVKFFKQVLKSCEQGKHPEPLYMDRFGYHPYKWLKAGNNTLPSLDKHQPATAKEIGIDSLATLETAVDDAVANNQVMTPDHQELLIDLDEYALMSHATGIYAHHNILDAQRARFYVRVLNRVCNDPRIGLLSFYQLDSTPRTAKAHGNFWDSSMITTHGVLGSSYYAVQTWAETNSSCLTR